MKHNLHFAQIVTITEKKDVYPALQKWFSRGGVPIG
jgi:uncharacterized protein